MIVSPVLAQDISLIDILEAKGILSKAEVQKLRSKKGEEQEQPALIALLKAKGILR